MSAGPVPASSRERTSYGHSKRCPIGRRAELQQSSPSLWNGLMMPRPDRNAPLWSAAQIMWLALEYDRQVKPKLFVIAIISAFMSALGIFSQFDNPTFADLMLSIVIGAALLAILAIFWIGAWLLPELVGGKALRVYAVVAVVGFLACFGVSTTANLSATGGVAALQIDQKEEIDRFDNEGAKVALYVDQLVVARDAIEARGELARQAESDEIAGRGPTGIGGAGSVSNSFGAARGIYVNAAITLDSVLERARSQSDALTSTVTEMRVIQADGALSQEERATSVGCSRSIRRGAFGQRRTPSRSGYRRAARPGHPPRPALLRSAPICAPLRIRCGLRRIASKRSLLRSRNRSHGATRRFSSPPRGACQPF